MAILILFLKYQVEIFITYAYYMKYMQINNVLISNINTNPTNGKLKMFPACQIGQHAFISAYISLSGKSQMNIEHSGSFFFMQLSSTVNEM